MSRVPRDESETIMEERSEDLYILIFEISGGDDFSKESSTIRMDRENSDSRAVANVVYGEPARRGRRHQGYRADHLIWI